MFVTFLRLQLAMLPMLFSLWQQADPAADPAKGDDPPADPPKGTFSQAEVNAMIAKEKREWEAKQAKAAEDAKASAEAERLKANQEWEKAAALAETAKQKAEQEVEAERLKARDRAVKAAVKLAAIKLNAVDEDAVYALLDRSQVALDDDGEPTNAETLVTALLQDKPYLVKPADGKRGIDPSPKPSNGKVTRDDIKNHYLEQAGVKPR